MYEWIKSISFVSLAFEWLKPVIYGFMDYYELLTIQNHSSIAADVNF